MTTDSSAISVIADVDAVAKSVLDCVGVMGLGDEIATDLPGRRVAGVRVSDDVVHLHVLGRYDITAATLCAEIFAAVGPFTRDKRIDIDIVDMVGPHEFFDLPG